MATICRPRRHTQSATSYPAPSSRHFIHRMQDRGLTGQPHPLPAPVLHRTSSPRSGAPGHPAASAAPTAPTPPQQRIRGTREDRRCDHCRKIVPHHPRGHGPAACRGRGPPTVPAGLRATHSAAVRAVPRLPAGRRPETSMRILDLFCGAGGAARGYVQAGHTVTGIDIDPGLETHYRAAGATRFKCLDWREAIATISDVDFYHASPPCQRHSKMSNCRPRAGSHISRPDRPGPRDPAGHRQAVRNRERARGAAGQSGDPVRVHVRPRDVPAPLVRAGRRPRASSSTAATRGHAGPPPGLRLAAPGAHQPRRPLGTRDIRLRVRARAPGTGQRSHGN